MVKLKNQRRFNDLPEASPQNVKGLAKDNQAILGKVPLFESQMVEVTDNVKIFVSGHENRKLGKRITKGEWSGMPIFHLTLPERMTCTTSCAVYDVCYGNAMPFARRHLPGAELEQRIIEDVEKLAKRYPRGFAIRLHTLGDFYSEQYIRLWHNLLGEFKELHIFGYTALGMSEDAGESAMAELIGEMNDEYPDQSYIRFSMDAPHPFGTVVINKPSEATGNTIICPAETGRATCCAECGLCWAKSAEEKTIAFMRHGMGSRTKDSLAEQASETDQFGKRYIRPMPQFVDLAKPISDEPPEMIWIDPSKLIVDEMYQRNLTRKSILQIQHIVQNFSWLKYKCPICVRVGKDYHVINGQHTAIGTATHPDIDQIPIMVGDAKTVAHRAAAFVSHNRDQIAVTAPQLHYSNLKAGDPRSVELQRLCEESGITIRKTPPTEGNVSIGDTLAVRVLERVVAKYGSDHAGRMFKVMTAGKLAPISVEQIRAVEKVMNDPGLSRSDQKNLSLALANLDVKQTRLKARGMAADMDIPLFEALATLYSREMLRIERESSKTGKPKKKSSSKQKVTA